MIVTLVYSADDNGLTELPDEFACLSALRFLSLQANSFRFGFHHRVAVAVRSLRRVLIVRAHCVRACSVVPRPLLSMTALERVDLSDNRIASIDDDVQEALLHMPRLRMNVRDNPMADQPLPAALQGILHEDW
jgi:Leucine-rich repeat (LRR) protein